MGSVIVLSCRYCMFVSCMHPVAVLNAAFSMTYSLLMLVEDARDNHMKGEYSSVLICCECLCCMRVLGLR